MPPAPEDRTRRQQSQQRQKSLRGLRINPAHARLVRSRAQGQPASESLRYVSGGRSRLLAKVGIGSVRDSLATIPRRYVDFTQVSSVLEAGVGDDVTVVVRVDAVKVKKPRPRMTVVEVACYDNSAVLFATYFGQPWMAQRFQQGQLVAFSGKMGFNYGFKRMNSPFFEVIDDEGAPPGSVAAEDAARIVPVYPTTEGLSAGWMRRIQAGSVHDYGDICDFWPAAWRLERQLISLGRALSCSHRPHSMDEAALARRRFAYDELIFLQLGLRLSRNARLPGVHPVPHVVTGPASRAVSAALPFELTEDQRNAVHEILKDMQAPQIMSRLLLGDVGTGKTAVATCLFGAVADTGCQAAVMAPTSVLASQYASKVGPVLDSAGISWGLLTGSTPARERTELLRRLTAGSLTVLFGTHALLTQDVVFECLSLVVIDEQQRFGVRQRHLLREKGRGADLLIMTATPIPRTLALSLYGDLDLSYLRQRPHAGAGVSTRVIARRDRGQAYDAMRAALEKGQQAYVVCPLIGVPAPEGTDTAGAAPDEAAAQLSYGNDPSDAAAAEQEARVLQEKVFPQARVGLLTGRMAAADKDRIMEDFRSNRINILVSTTVIEVGVDVPNATVMLIEDGERFGLAQLHQLRGRVGRGQHPGTVFISTGNATPASRARLKALEKTSDGFELAEEDLKLRREGELLGSRQSGDVSLRYADLLEDADLVAAARVDAMGLLSRDPKLEEVEHLPLKDELLIRHGDVLRELGGG